MTKTSFPFGVDFQMNTQLPEDARESAHQIWLAGLGAFAKAQQEGEKAFQTLVKDGMNLQKASPQEAQQKIAEATAKMTALANDMATKATGGWGKLENIFEDRVSRALKQLGVPTQDELQQLRDEVAALKAQVQALSGSGSAKKPAAAGAPAKSASKPTVKRAAPAARKASRSSK